MTTGVGVGKDFTDRTLAERPGHNGGVRNQGIYQLMQGVRRKDVRSGDCEILSRNNSQEEAFI